MHITVSLYYHLKEKAGKGNFDVEIKEPATIKDLIILLEQEYPALRTHLDNVMILMNKKIVLNEDIIKDQAEVAFLTPVGGG